MQPRHDILEDILHQFGVRLLAPLGGRRNQHWHVQSGRDPWVLRRWAQAMDSASIDWEVRLVARLAARGWPVAPAVAGPLSLEGHVWSLAPVLPGDPPETHHGGASEQRARGRLLAQFHVGLAEITEMEPRPGWRRAEAILSDPALDGLLTQHARERPEEARILQWHLERARERIAPLSPATRPGRIIHGDFTPWNLRFVNGQLSGILDFELARPDHRVADFALSWRGKYDEVIRGYDEIAPLTPEEWDLISPLWWAELIEGACRDLLAGRQDDGWTIRKLLQRSPLMGLDAAPFR